MSVLVFWGGKLALDSVVAGTMGTFYEVFT